MKITTEDEMSPVNINKNHRQRMRAKFLYKGLENFSDIEMLELLLYFSIPQADTEPTAQRLLNKLGSFTSVFEATYNQLTSVNGVGEQSATLIKLVPALMQEYNKRKLISADELSNQKQAIRYIEGIFKGISIEQFYVFCLDPQNHVISMQEMSSGTGTSTNVEVSIRSITGFCINQNCNRIIVAHNHPRSNETPTLDDINMTKKLFNSCVLNDIDVIDHIIVASNTSFSFGEHNTMQTLKKEVLQDLKFIPEKDKQKFYSSTANYIIV